MGVLLGKPSQVSPAAARAFSHQLAQIHHLEHQRRLVALSQEKLAKNGYTRYQDKYLVNLRDEFCVGGFSRLFRAYCEDLAMPVVMKTDFQVPPNMRGDHRLELEAENSRKALRHEIDIYLTLHHANVIGIPQIARYLPAPTPAAFSALIVQGLGFNLKDIIGVVARRFRGVPVEQLLPLLTHAKNSEATVASMLRGGKWSQMGGTDADVTHANDDDDDDDDDGTQAEEEEDQDDAEHCVAKPVFATEQLRSEDAEERELRALLSVLESQHTAAAGSQAPPASCSTSHSSSSSSRRPGRARSTVADRLDVVLVCWLATRCLEVLKRVHRAGVIHRDVKPHNFCLTPYMDDYTEYQMPGIGGAFHDAMHVFVGLTFPVYLIDFGVAQYATQASEEHDFCGTVTYASVRAHQRLPPHPIDDLESLAYMLIFMAVGSLPWYSKALADRMPVEKQLALALQLKQDMPARVLCATLPPVFGDFLAYVRRYSEQLAGLSSAMRCHLTQTRHEHRHHHQQHLSGSSAAPEPLDYERWQLAFGQTFEELQRRRAGG